MLFLWEISTYYHLFLSGLLSLCDVLPRVGADSSSSCFYCNTDFYGGDIPGGAYYKTVGSVSDCQQHCLAHPKCLYFTFSPHSRSCYLKDADTGRYSSMHHTLGLVAGPKNCPPIRQGMSPLSTQLPCFECNTDYRGGDIMMEAIDIRGYRSSEEQEEAHPKEYHQRRLAAYDYLGSSELPPGREARDAADGHVDVSQSSPSFLECEKKCQQTTGCVKYSFVPSLGRCFLKGSDISEAATHYGTIGIISAVLDCYRNDDSKADVRDQTTGGINGTTAGGGCVKVDTDYFGGDIMYIGGVSTYTECLELCKEHIMCQYFTLAEERCYLKYTKNLEVVNSHTKGFISGTRDCDEKMDVPSQSEALPQTEYVKETGGEEPPPAPNEPADDEGVAYVI
eukprot:GHVS01045452.1.p1 GENE.GHVS01045452.1~~GHVS01045452.1.p1  ORF type:complete len:394 (-),score=68.51 GHVS01045452.1:459-1640(-)